MDTLFPLPPSRLAHKKVRNPDRPVWSENKARLIDRYLYYFVQITKHGTYIDGFAGPQAPDKTEAWSARMVIESKPRWLRNFYLFDNDPAQVRFLEQMVQSQSPREKNEPKRRFLVRQGDFNELVDIVLQDGRITEREASFCLLDQRCFECEWRTVERLARFKKTGHKIELFYFLANGWLDRSLAAVKNETIVERWWGRSDWRLLQGIERRDRADLFAKRFRSELGYQSAIPWPIYGRHDGQTVMYYMIHATDHPEAPALMSRAYAKANVPKEPLSQLALALGQNALISNPERPSRR